jgi:uncharacterized membrane protein HdeD (DUF308 family)
MATNVDRGMLTHEWGRHGWSVALRGVIAVVFGVLAILWPGISLAVILLLFGIYAIVDGILCIVAVITTPEARSRWWALVAVGLVGIAAGIITFVYPGITILGLLAIIAAWALVTGVFELVLAALGPSVMEHKWLWAVSGILSVIFAILLFRYPVAGLLAVVWMIGLYAIMFGVTLISLGLQVSRVEHGLTSAMQH